ncbi:hypothetical protein TWF718_001802 [Orbilia javanica]|uniref:Uncharacterized protein n=1 Tax=Orbilia javanica TaxID=47235 RepID=A0AAN8RNP3_9PEZI
MSFGIDGRRWSEILQFLKAELENELTISNPGRMNEVIQAAQEICQENCRCAGSLGVMTIGNNVACRDFWQVGKCRLIYGCHCFARLGQPRVENTERPPPLRHEFQNAIDLIPRPIRELSENFGWEWLVDPRIARSIAETMRYSPDSIFDVAQENEPPLRLSGPNRNILPGHEPPNFNGGGAGPSDWHQRYGAGDWRGRGRGGGGGSGRGGGVKRDLVSVESLRKTGSDLRDHSDPSLRKGVKGSIKMPAVLGGSQNANGRPAE